MAYIILKNSLTDYKAAKVNVNIPKFTDINTDDGDPIFTIEVGTTVTSISGSKVSPAYKTDIGDHNNLDSLIEDAISIVANKVDWGILYDDTKAPYVESAYPLGNEVEISSSIKLDIIDSKPASGIDMSDARIYLNNGYVDFDITDECFINGNPFKYNIKWAPKKVIRNFYGD
jgi:hypothetical protein